MSYNTNAEYAIVGEIRIFPYDYEPEGWMLCDGRELKAIEYQALYALLGSRFGGDPIPKDVPFSEMENFKFRIPKIRAYKDGRRYFIATSGQFPTHC